MQHQHTRPWPGYSKSTARLLEDRLRAGLPDAARRENDAAGLRGGLPQAALGGVAAQTAQARETSMDRLLSLLAEHPEMSVRHMAKLLNRSISTTHQYVRALAAEGKVERRVKKYGAIYFALTGTGS